MPGNCIGRIHRAVLAASTAEIHRQIGESALQIALDRGVDNPLDILDERSNLAVGFEEIAHRFVETGEMFEWFISAGVVWRPAVEYKAASVA